MQQALRILKHGIIRASSNVHPSERSFSKRKLTGLRFISLNFQKKSIIDSSISLDTKLSAGTNCQKTLLNSFVRCLSISRDELVKRNRNYLKLEEQRRQRQASWIDLRRNSKQHDSTHEITLQSQPNGQVSEDFSGFTLSNVQPLATQPLTGPLRPESDAERSLASIVARPDLMVTRNIEYWNIFMGFEQQNRYIITDPHKAVTIGFFLEKSNVILRQILRGHRPWAVTVFDSTGRPLCIIRRSFYFVSSEASVEIDGRVVGWVQQRWHLWKRNYDLYTVNADGKKVQFAAMDNPGFWWWTFTLKNEDGQVLGVVDRDFRGLGLELFTDAGQYFIRFGDVTATGAATHSAGRASNVDPKFAEIARAADNVPLLEVARPLSIRERLVTLALAISIDNDFFSRHSNGGGMHFGLWGSSEN